MVCIYNYRISLFYSSFFSFLLPKFLFYWISIVSLEQRRAHQAFHQQHPQVTTEESQQRIPDLTCSVCYPPFWPSKVFRDFWHWYSHNFPGARYNAYTVQGFFNLIQASDQYSAALNFVALIAHHQIPSSIEQHATEILEALEINNNFFEDSNLFESQSEATNSTTESSSNMSYQPASASRIILQQGDADTPYQSIHTPVATPQRTRSSRPLSSPPPYSSNAPGPSAPNASLLSSQIQWDTSL